MSYETVRKALTELILAIKPSDATLVIGNDPFDWSNPPEVFTSVKISFEGARQIGVEAQPRTRFYGFLRWRTHVREGLGTKPAADALDWIQSGVEYQVVMAPGVRITLETLVPDDDTSPVKGWCLHDADILFRVSPA